MAREVHYHNSDSPQDDRTFMMVMLVLLVLFILIFAFFLWPKMQLNQPGGGDVDVDLQNPTQQVVPTTAPTGDPNAEPTEEPTDEPEPTSSVLPTNSPSPVVQ